jgi:acyl-CoA thioester hydrolase
MGVVWHGSYVRYFEDGREAFGRAFGLTYLDVYENGFFIPVVKSEIDYKGIVLYGEEVQITTRLIPTPAAKMVFEYEVFNLTKNRLAAKGKTIQVFMLAETKELYLNAPEFYVKWMAEQGIR